MSKMIQFVEEMAARISKITGAEQELVRALGEALSRTDLRLLRDVRRITTEHESRRGAILHELQDLAPRIGTFPNAREPMLGAEYAEPTGEPVAAANGIPAASGIAAAANDHMTSHSRGDWRQATSNIQDEFDGFFEERVALSH